MNLQRVIDLYRKIALVPRLVRATMVPMKDSRYVLESVWQQRDLEREENVRFKKWSSVSVNNSSINVEASLHSSETSGELLSSYTKCGNLKALIREVADKEKKKVQYLEVWEKSKKIINIDLKNVDKHGNVHSNVQFGCLEWSSDKKRILYVAEMKIPKSGSYFKAGGKKDEKSEPGNKHLYKESWGEQLVECHHPTICVFDVDSREVSTFTDLIPDDISAGTGIWCHDNETIAFVGWSHEPFRLGLIYGPIRKSSIYLLNLKQGVCKMLTDGLNCVFAPRLHPFENKLLYLQNPIGGPHQNSSKLMSVEIPSPKNFDEKSSPKVVVDTVKFAKNLNDFPGLFLFELPQRCWSSDGRYMFLTSAWRSSTSTLAVDIRKGEVMRLTEESEAIVCDVIDDMIVMSLSAPSTPNKLMIGKFEGTQDIDWVTVEQPCEEPFKLKWSVQQFEPKLKNSEFPEVDAEYILYEPMDQKSIGGQYLIVNPHGGPHTHDACEFDIFTALFCELGFTVVQVNYRGSDGFGTDGIYSLPGRIGTQDVSDVHQVAEKVRTELKMDKVFVTGGSHGGFLTLHLISQFPDFYSAAVIRNGVTNLAALEGVTDIPDWTWVEADAGTFTHDILPTAESYAKMLEKSPIVHIEKAKAPCLVMLGEEDLRCHPSQGRMWAKKYKALGRKCKILEYAKNNHPLDKVDAEADSYVNMARWFFENM